MNFMKHGSRTCTISGNYEIATAIRLPSAFSLVLALRASATWGDTPLMEDRRTV